MISARRYIFVALNCMFFGAIQAVERLGGNGIDQSFAHAMQAHAFYAPTASCYMGAPTDDLKGNSYVLSYAHRASSSFVPLAHAKVVLNGKEQDNPLHGAGITHISVGGQRPLVVTQSAPDTVYYLFDFDVQGKDVKMMSSPVVNDAQGVAGDIVALCGTPAAQAMPLFFALVKSRGTDFGAVGSGIAVGSLYEKENKQLAIQLISALTDATKKQSDIDAHKAILLDKTGSVFSMGIAAQSMMTSRAPLVWHQGLQFLYIGVGVVGGKESTHGVCAAALLKLVASSRENETTKKEEKITLCYQVPLLPPAALTTDARLAILGIKGCSSAAIVHQMVPMKTSTLVSYMVVQGGVGNITQQARKVYALPLVTRSSEKMIMGTIASKKQKPVDMFDESKGLLVRRDFMVAATTPDEVVYATEPAALVGGGDAPGDITHVVVHGDAVFVATATAGNGLKPGIFHSQAVFDVWGAIQGWTAWTRVANCDREANWCEFDAQTASFWYADYQKYANEAVETTRNVYRTQWDKDPKVSGLPLAQKINELFLDNKGGVQGLMSYPFDTPGFSQEVGNRLSLVVATGNKQVLIVASGDDHVDGNFGPCKDFTQGYSSVDGTLKGFVPGCSYISVTGGALDRVGDIVASALVTKDAESWLFVGGEHGVAVLAHDDGSGFDLLGDGLRGFDGRLKFFSFGNYRDVHKLQDYNERLCVATSRELDVLIMSKHSIKSQRQAGNQAHAGVMHSARAQKTQPSFNALHDFYMRDGIAIIATDRGLLYTIGLKDNAVWLPIALPYAVSGPGQIVPVVPHGLSFARAGNMFIGDPSFEDDRERVYRHVFLKKDGEQAIIPFPDILLKQTGRGYLMDLGVARDYLATDGALFFFSGASFSQRKLFVELISDGVSSGNVLAARKAHVVDLFDRAKTLGPVTREYASGAWLMWGSFGVRAQA